LSAVNLAVGVTPKVRIVGDEDRTERLPSGTVTFLFTDVEGSTRLWQDEPHTMRVALERHDEILRIAIAAHGGYVFTTAGDSFAAAFQDHLSAASAASAAQTALGLEVWPAEAPISVRMGVHTGDAWERDGDYFGPTLSVAARMMNAGHGGQVLVSAATNGLLHDVPTRSLGVHRLRDLSEPQEIFELGGRDVEFLPLRTLDRVRHNLPVVADVLLGREETVEEIVTAIVDHPVATIVGVGGIGKTRLALEVAARSTSRFADGVWLCELAPVGDEAAVAQVVADAIGTRQWPKLPMVDSVAEFCRHRKMLMVIDNCEHVLDAAAELIETVVAAAPGVRLLATSREGLGCAG
jgi:class 3 adenylate cyclase